MMDSRQLGMSWNVIAVALLMLLFGGLGCEKAQQPSAPGASKEGENKQVDPKREETAAAPVDVAFWYSYGGRNREVTEELIKRFNAAHPNIRIKGDVSFLSLIQAMSAT